MNQQAKCVLAAGEGSTLLTSKPLPPPASSGVDHPRPALRVSCQVVALLGCVRNYGCDRCFLALRDGDVCHYCCLVAVVLCSDSLGYYIPLTFEAAHGGVGSRTTSTFLLAVVGGRCTLPSAEVGSSNGSPPLTSRQAEQHRRSRTREAASSSSGAFVFFSLSQLRRSVPCSLGLRSST